MRFGVLVGVIAALAAAQAAQNHEFVHGPFALAFSAQPPSPPPPTGACGGWASTTFADGCTGAPPASAYTIQHPDFFSGYARQSGQSYVTTGGCKGNANCHPPWATAGVDYPVGVSTQGCPTSGPCGPGTGNGFGNPGGATDPTNSSSPNYGNGNPGHCAKQRINAIYCGGPTSAEVDIGPFDFSYQGNCVKSASPCQGVGMGLTLGPGLTGPCVIHDSYFVFDLSETQHNTGVAAYNFSGCSSLTIKNSVFRLRNDTTSPPTMDALWAPLPGPPPTTTTGSSNLFYFVAGNAAPTSSAVLNRPLILEYDAFIHCPSRCFSTGALQASHNYLEGVNMYAIGAFAAHGDGWMASFYNGPNGPNTRQICNCSGIDTFSEKFDTWLSPNYGAGATSCFTCALVNVGAGHINGNITQGSNVLAVTSVRMNYAGTYPDIGMPIGASSAWYAYAGPAPPTATPKIVGCKDASGVSGCSATQAATCTTATPCDYTLNVNWTANATGCAGPGCSFNLLFNADVNIADYENNVWVGNLITSTGAAPDGGCIANQFPCMTVQSIWWAGYGVYQNVTVKNNYVDLCGVGGNGIRVGVNVTSDGKCLVPPTGLTPRWFGGAAPETSAQEGGNVLMTNGAYFTVFKTQNSISRRSPKSPPASLLPAPTRPQGPGPRPQPRQP